MIAHHNSDSNTDGSLAIRRVKRKLLDNQLTAELFARRNLRHGKKLLQ
jgi:hypothetical protein